MAFTWAWTGAHGYSHTFPSGVTLHKEACFTLPDFTTVPDGGDPSLWTAHLLIVAGWTRGGSGSTNQFSYDPVVGTEFNLSLIGAGGGGGGEGRVGYLPVDSSAPGLEWRQGGTVYLSLTAIGPQTKAVAVAAGLIWLYPVAGPGGIAWNPVSSSGFSNPTATSFHTFYTDEPFGWPAFSLVGWGSEFGFTDAPSWEIGNPEAWSYGAVELENNVSAIKGAAAAVGLYEAVAPSQGVNISISGASGSPGGIMESAIWMGYSQTAPSLGRSFAQIIG